MMIAKATTESDRMAYMKLPPCEMNSYMSGFLLRACYGPQHSAFRYRHVDLIFLAGRPMERVGKRESPNGGVLRTNQQLASPMNRFVFKRHKIRKGEAKPCVEKLKCKYLYLLCLFLVVPLAGGAQSGRSKDDLFNAKRLDGVEVEAIETYVNPKTHEIGISLGLYPFNPYYNAFSIAGSYSYYFSRYVAWEVFQAALAFTVDKNLTAQLADLHTVNPQTIERLQLLASSNLVWVPIYGKFVLTKSVIQYFRVSLLAGVALASTSIQSSVGISLGTRFETYINDSFSWRIEIRDIITLTSSPTNYLVFGLGTAISF